MKELEEFGIPAHLPQMGYLYKYVSVETALLIIQHNSLKYSRAADLNDPFEVSLEIFNSNMTTNDVRQLINRKANNLSTKEKRRLMTSGKENKILFKDALSSQVEVLRNTFGICCFSELYNSTLMWTHYAKNHTGVCLAFDIDYKDDLFIFYVKYIKNLESLQYWKERELIFIKWLYTKSNIWSYEKEIRAITTEKTGLIKFEKSCLKEIHFGMRTHIDDEGKIQALTSLTNYPDIDFYKMYIKPMSFDIARKKI